MNGAIYGWLGGVTFQRIIITQSFFFCLLLVKTEAVIFY